ncbi:uracil-DNA glycosylase [Paenibacillus sp. J2TS4]|uniref:uracil-DNA glycosylase n=1 Tax=Paenibacillus sp. J2TS4 TaxID=2807194 RepID=UPI001B23AE1F|nr:uracil-DNA glycosylase [Paenibacillus sp. J2TS4]GIP34131.1 uracil-DNA glycosylase [Paenibacillus sp. J2TS4]
MFKAVSWREEPAPEHARDCRNCELADQRTRVIWGEGHPEASVLVLLDNPGEREDREGQPYVCGTRQTLQKAAGEVGFTEDDLYVTYLLKCRPRRAYDKEKARAACRGHLMLQLEQKLPRFIFCLGNTAVQSFLGDPEAEVKQMRGRWLEVDGRHLLVSYHPLAVRRRPNLYSLFVEDWRRLYERYHLELAKTNSALR